MKAKLIVIGYGWRADFFYRIAKELPEEFEIAAGVLRTKERAAQVQREQGVFATDNLAEALEKGPDFAVLCVPRAVTKDYLIRLMELKIPVLCETPPAKDTAELLELYGEYKRLKGKVQVVEQYFLQPLYAAWLRAIEKGLIGEVSNMSLSALHGYHAVSIFRKMLGTGFARCRIKGESYSFPVTLTNGRDGFNYSGQVVHAARDKVVLEFENGKTAFFDFSGEQYFSLIRTRNMNVQGVRGEIQDMEIRYLREDNRGVLQSLNRIDAGVYNNSGWTHQGIMLGEEFLYENPFYGARLNDDEIAVADCLRRMKIFTDHGEDFYPLKEAIYDTYLSFLMEEAVSSGNVLESEELFGE